MNMTWLVAQFSERVHLESQGTWEVKGETELTFF